METLTPLSPEHRLEQHEILTFIPCPFALPDAAERDFLFRQRERRSGHKNMSFDPERGTVTGFVRESAEQAEQLRRILEHFAHSAQNWLSRLVPGYAHDWRRDCVSYRPEEEATRRLRQSARNDLLHVDAFPTRPTGGHRILRLFVNLHATEPLVWVTSDSFAELLRRFGPELNRSAGQWTWKVRQGLLRLFDRDDLQRSEYDDFMLRLHHFLKSRDDFQERARKKFHQFAPGTAWLAFTDGFCHAELRGRFILEHSFFIDPQHLALPDQAPVALWKKSRQLSTQAA
jgi:hypothetical protein